jgi:hypothetical protein
MLARTPVIPRTLESLHAADFLIALMPYDGYFNTFFKYFKPSLARAS